MKLFKTSNIVTVKYCQEFFGFDLPSVVWAKLMQSLKLSLLCICLINQIVYLPCHAVQLTPPRYSYFRIYIFVYLYI